MPAFNQVTYNTSHYNAGVWSRTLSATLGMVGTITRSFGYVRALTARMGMIGSIYKYGIFQARTVSAIGTDRTVRSVGTDRDREQI